MTEFRNDVLPTGHRGRGSGIGLSLEDLERATSVDRFRGTVWYVNSAASAGRNGRSWGSEFQTLTKAVGAASADDTILVAPMHVETVTAAAGLVLNKAGLKILGFGNGDRRPQINFTTAVGADMDVSSAGITMRNIRFTGGIDALTGPIDVNAADFTLIDCITEDVTGQATDFIVSDANADRMTLIRWEHRGSGSAGADSAIQMTGGDQITIEDAWIHGNFAAACIESIVTPQTNLRIYGGASRPCYLRSLNAACVVVTCVTGATGDIGPFIYGRLLTDAANITEAVVGDAMRIMQPVALVNANGERGFKTNIAASVG